VLDYPAEITRPLISVPDTVPRATLGSRIVLTGWSGLPVGGRDRPSPDELVLTDAVEITRAWLLASGGGSTPPHDRLVDRWPRPAHGRGPLLPPRLPPSHRRPRGRGPGSSTTTGGW
jgi:hypothetical protein